MASANNFLELAIASEIIWRISVTMLMVIVGLLIEPSVILAILRS